MIDLVFERLRSLGLTPALAAAASAAAPLPEEPAASEADASQTAVSPNAASPRLVRITEVHRETVRAHDGERDIGARVRPRLARALQEQDTVLAVGDWAWLTAEPHGAAWILARVEPLSHIARRGADGRRHPVVSNVDWALLVMGLDDDLNLRRLERYLALVHGSGGAPLSHGSSITPVVVLTKADVAARSPGLVPARLAAVRARVSSAVEVLAVNGLAPDAADALRPYLGTGQTLVLLGSSGAGKSTLTNTLLGAAVQDTGAVRQHDSRGKHTTTSRSLHRLPSGACVIDTPGLRALRPDVDESTLAVGFGDIASLAPACRFRDCRHQDEPGCAVRAGVDGDRLRNYHKLLREARRDTMSVLERQQLVAQWKVRGKAGKARAKAKREEL